MADVIPQVQPDPIPPPPVNETAPMGSDVVDYTPKPPEAVRRAARRANELAAQIKAEQDASRGTFENPVQLSAPAAPGPAPAAPSPPPVQPELPLQAPDTWEARYRTLQGKYDREMPQLRQQINGMEQLIAAMRVAPPVTPAPAPFVAQPQPVTVDIPEEDINAYGPELIERSRAWAHAEFAPVVNDLKRQIEELKGGQQVQTRNQQNERVHTDLDRDPEIGAHWRQMNVDQNVLEWLKQIDPFSGQPLQVLLGQAYNAGDSPRVARFFKRYLHEHTVTPQTGNGIAAQTPYSNGVAGPVDLTEFAAPGRSYATPGVGAPDRRIWTNAEIQAFYSDRAKGRYRGREQLSDQLERDIFAAAAEGRVHNG